MDNQKGAEVFYFKGSDIGSDDVVFETENEITKTPAQKKATVIELLTRGLLTDKDGNLTERTKSKILDVLGYGSFDSVKDLTSLHRQRAEKENVELENRTLTVEEYDDHLIHIDEHTRLLLTLDDDKKALKTKLYEHIKNHKKFDIIEQNTKNLISGEIQNEQ